MRHSPDRTFLTTTGRHGMTAPTYDPGTVEFKVNSTTVGLGIIFSDNSTTWKWHRVELLLLHPDYPKLAPRLTTGNRNPPQVTVEQSTRYTSPLHFLANAWDDLKTKRPNMTQAAYFRAGVEVFVVTHPSAFVASLPDVPSDTNHPIWSDSLDENSGNDAAKVFIAEVSGASHRQLHQLATLSDDTLDDSLTHARASEPTGASSLRTAFGSAAASDIYSRSHVLFDTITGGPLPARLPPAPPTFTVQGADRADPISISPPAGSVRE